MPADVHRILAYRDSVPESYRRCIFTREEVPTLDLDAGCSFGPAPPRVLIWGDSHAARLAQPWARRWPNTASACAS
ncbi:MAG: hypothetical protein R3D85_07160 [Paracoccaceae bacterium]